MSPELLHMHMFKDKKGSFNKEKADIFSIGITFLRLSLLVYEGEIEGLNDCTDKNTTDEILELVNEIDDNLLKLILGEMLKIDPKERIKYF